jgi:hypothetical protein
VGEFYSIAISNNQQVDSGTKMIHLGQEHVEPHHLQGHRAGFSQNTYRGLVSAHRKAENARNFTQCDSLLIGDKCGAHTVPYIEARTPPPSSSTRRPPRRSAGRPAVLLPMEFAARLIGVRRRKRWR